MGLSANKVVAKIFGDSSAVIHIDYLEQVKTDHLSELRGNSADLSWSR